MEIIITFLGFYYSNLRSSNQKIPNGQKNGKKHNHMHGLVFEKNIEILQYFRCIKKYCNTFVLEQN